ncbi:hypothetical protein EST38_g12183 [Candolleomyces aberdarensis]|uniref:Uncharacterized protein n=1 Tax=Candolleomyces aberdarensis TaxID=2316362 RepID=A0A4Q2D316_9AGAR|nr:hypothetical protein EST38_g12183 [Candolleomyces aberdarensis]
MELKNALKRRSYEALTPYRGKEWEKMLNECGLLDKYERVVEGLRHGFHLGIPVVNTTFTPPNHRSVKRYAEAFQTIVQQELKTQRYLGPCTAQEMEQLIGLFQSSPISLIPKAGRPGKFCAIHNFSHPYEPKGSVNSINTHISTEEFPCTWGMFSTIWLLVARLPPSSQVSIRDVAEAYRTIPAHPNQWPGLVVKLGDDNSYAINTCNDFGLVSGGGAYGMVADAELDIFRRQGMGPASRWVDDHFFVRILWTHLAEYNAKRKKWCGEIKVNGGHIQERSRIWYKGKPLASRHAEEFDEDMEVELRDLTTERGANSEAEPFCYNDDDIDQLSAKLGTIWEKSKTVHFQAIVPFLGLSWDLDRCTVSLLEEKQAKYLHAIKEWKSREQHTLEQVQGLYGKLLHTTLVIPKGRAYLTKLESMLGTFNDRPFVLHHAP